MNREELKIILDNHILWLEETGGERADLTGANLIDADLTGANLRNAELRKANLNGTDLTGANLRNAYLKESDLRFADLRNADLRGANLSGANLSEVDLRGANLNGADLIDTNLMSANLEFADLGSANLMDTNLKFVYLSNVNLIGANLNGADLSGSDLIDTNLTKADLRYANLAGAKLNGTNLTDAIVNSHTMGYHLQCPEKGIFTAFKKCISLDGEPLIVELLIPEDAKRSSATTRKCRASKAIVIGIEDMDGAKHQSAYSKFRSDFKYEVGKELVVDDFDDNRWNECSTGIHFFITREEAVDYEW